MTHERSSPETETAVTLEELLDRSVHMEIIVEDGTRWHFSKEQLDLARAALAAAKARTSGHAPRTSEEAFEEWFNSNLLDPDGGSSHLPKWFKGDMRRAWDAALSHSSTPRSPVMQAADKATKIVDGWSDAKREYAERVTNSSPDREGK